MKVLFFFRGISYQKIEHYFIYQEKLLWINWSGKWTMLCWEKPLSLSFGIFWKFLLQCFVQTDWCLLVNCRNDYLTRYQQFRVGYVCFFLNVSPHIKRIASLGNCKKHFAGICNPTWLIHWTLLFDIINSFAPCRRIILERGSFL